MRPDQTSKVLRPRFVALDTSHLVEVARDKYSRDQGRRRTAQEFEEVLLDSGCVLLLCWHHVNELLKHRNQAVVSDRLAFIRSLPMVSWIRSFDDTAGLGTIVDILAAESRAALDSSCGNAIAVRDRASEGLIQFGNGEDIRRHVETWRELQPELWRQEERARELIAISRSNYVDISQRKVVEFLSGQIRTPEDANRQFELLRQRLTDDIKSRGDRKIPDAAIVAAKFFDQVRRDSAVMLCGAPDAALQCLLNQGIDITDIKPDTTMEEITDLATFRTQLRVVCRTLGVSWSHLKASVNMASVPSWIIQDGLRKYGQDLPERQGSELTDRHLACLSAYADITYVDKRTSENFKRARRKCSNFAAITNRVEKAGHYSEIIKQLN